MEVNNLFNDTWYKLLKNINFCFLTFVLLKSLSILNLIKESQKMGVASFYMLLYDNYGVSVLAYTSLS